MSCRLKGTHVGRDGHAWRFLFIIYINEEVFLVFTYCGSEYTFLPSGFNADGVESPEEVGPVPLRVHQAQRARLGPGGVPRGGHDTSVLTARFRSDPRMLRARDSVRLYTLRTRLIHVKN